MRKSIKYNISRNKSTTSHTSKAEDSIKAIVKDDITKVYKSVKAISKFQNILNFELG